MQELAELIKTPDDLLKIGSEIIKLKEVRSISLEIETNDLSCSDETVRKLLNGTTEFDVENPRHWAIYRLAKYISSKWENMNKKFTGE